MSTTEKSEWGYSSWRRVPGFEPRSDGRRFYKAVLKLEECDMSIPIWFWAKRPVKGLQWLCKKSAITFSHDEMRRFGIAYAILN